MKQKEIVKTVEKSGKRIHRLFKKIGKDFDDEDIHDFRVEIKTLRAFLRLLAFESGHYQPSIPKKIKAFYGCIGMIRNHRLQRQYTSNFIQEHQLAMPATYLQMLDTEEAFWKQQALKLMDDTNFSDEVATIEKKLPGKLTKSAVHWFIKAKLKDVNRYKLQLEADDTLHSVRKVIKDFQYTWPYIRKHVHLPAGISNIKEIKTATDLLGSFMDKVVQASSIQLFDKSTVQDEAELKTVQQLEAVCWQEKAELKRRVIAAIQLPDIPAKKPELKKLTGSIAAAME